MSTDHKSVGYRGGCRCTECVEKHRVQGNNYYNSVKAELTELCQFKPGVLQLLGEHSCT